MIRTPTERVGFTLIELLLALALLGILLGLGIVSLSPLVAQSHLDTATIYLQSALEEAQIRALRNLRSYRVQLEQQEAWLESKQSSNGKQSNFGKYCRKAYQLLPLASRLSVLVALLSERP